MISTVIIPMLVEDLFSGNSSLPKKYAEWSGRFWDILNRLYFPMIMVSLVYPFLTWFSIEQHIRHGIFLVSERLPWPAFEVSVDLTFSYILWGFITLYHLRKVSQIFHRRGYLHNVTVVQMNDNNPFFRRFLQESDSIYFTDSFLTKSIYYEKDQSNRFTATRHVWNGVPFVVDWHHKGKIHRIYVLYRYEQPQRIFSLLGPAGVDLSDMVREAEAFDVREHVPPSMVSYKRNGQYGGMAWLPTLPIHACALDQLVCSKETEDALRTAVKNFQDEKRAAKLHSIGLPNRLSILLHGPPGTGKSTFAKSLAQHFKRHMIQVEHSSPSTFFENRSELDISKYVIFFDDADFWSLEKRQENTAIIPGTVQTHPNFLLSNLMNFLDNPGDNAIIVFATNYIDKFDPALFRFGRISDQIHIPVMDLFMFSKLFTNVYGTPKEFVDTCFSLEEQQMFFEKKWPLSHVSENFVLPFLEDVNGSIAAIRKALQ
jgi:hypothetical protein